MRKAVIRQAVIDFRSGLLLDKGLKINRKGKPVPVSETEIKTTEKLSKEAEAFFLSDSFVVWVDGTITGQEIIDRIKAQVSELKV